MPDNRHPGRVPCECYECQGGIPDGSDRMVDDAVGHINLEDSCTFVKGSLTIRIGSISLLNP
jgi:hypothetical protein